MSNASVQPLFLPGVHPDTPRQGAGAGVGGAEKKLAQGSVLQPAGRLHEGAEGLGRPHPAGDGVMDLRLGLSRAVRPGPPLFHLVSGGGAESTAKGPASRCHRAFVMEIQSSNGWGEGWGQGYLQHGGQGLGRRGWPVAGPVRTKPRGWTWWMQEAFGVTQIPRLRH